MGKVHPMLEQMALGCWMISMFVHNPTEHLKGFGILSGQGISFYPIDGFQLSDTDFTLTFLILQFIHLQLQLSGVLLLAHIPFHFLVH